VKARVRCRRQVARPIRLTPYKPVPAGKRKLERVTFLNCNCISPESPGRRLIEEIQFSFRLERAYLYK
jgi:hypothetical protein